MTSMFKRAFRHLGQLLVDEGRLPDVDAVFFLTLDQLALLAQEPHPELVQLALRRRRVLAEQMRLEYPDVCFGKPRPHSHMPGDITLDDGLSGTPVSRGIAVGPARAAMSLEEAAELQPGEILIVPYADVGWTPYFSLAAGLATDIGAPFTHGAVVAREHGLPAVMNLRSATRAFKTGDLVVLNGNDGTLKRVKPEGAEEADDAGA
jgi:phosphohistidine swiveling domain-containing protein